MENENIINIAINDAIKYVLFLNLINILLCLILIKINVIFHITSQVTNFSSE